jgi:uncharacterized protein YndB with AHSA1/START domain
MTATSTATTGTAVQKSITVAASQQRAFDVFTAEFDTWWPRTHHIGKSPMTKGVIEGWVGGRCYSMQEDGTDCDWAKIVAWEPPHKLVMAWMITHEWGYEPDLAKASEVEIRFTPLDGGRTRVDLEHRNFERMGPGGAAMRTAVDGGWVKLLELFAARATESRA